MNTSKPGFSTEKLKVETADGRVFTLLEPFTYTRKDGTVIQVPAGTQSNGASTPRLLWRILPPFGTYWKASFLHDHLYESGKYDKDYSDETFLEAMEISGTPDIASGPIYEGVHVFGWPAWSACRTVEDSE